MSENYKVQVSYKVGTNMAGMINLRGDSVGEVDMLLGELRELLLPGLAGFEEEAKAIGLIASAFPATTGVAQQPAQGAAQPTNGASPTCIHGARVHRSGADWQGWFCPAQKDDPSKCKPQYIR